MQTSLVIDDPVLPQISPKKSSLSRSIGNLFLAFLVLSQAYYWYRYPLQVNATGTSATYDNTPVILQEGKYLMGIGFCVAIALSLLRSIRHLTFSRFFVISNFLSGVFLGVLAFKYLATDSSEGKFIATSLIKAAFVAPPVALSIPFLLQPEFLKRFEFWGIHVAMAYHVIYSMVQLELYYSIGRLPALASEDGLVRFGGGWDDPNVFGLFLTLPFLYLLTAKNNGLLKKSLAFAYGGLIAILLGLTVSYSALISFLIAFTVCAALSKLRTLMVLFFSVALVAVIIALSPPLQSLIEFSLEWKQSSVEQHLEQISAISNFFTEDIATILFGRGDEMTYYENFYEMILINLGLIFLVVLVFFMGATILCGLWKYYRAKRLKDETGARLFLIGVSFLTAFCLGSLMIPYFVGYPVNIYFWVFSFLMWGYPVTRPPQRVSNS